MKTLYFKHDNYTTLDWALLFLPRKPNPIVGTSEINKCLKAKTGATFPVTLLYGLYQLQRLPNQICWSGLEALPCTLVIIITLVKVEGSGKEVLRPHTSMIGIRETASQNWFSNFFERALPHCFYRTTEAKQDLRKSGVANCWIKGK